MVLPCFRIDARGGPGSRPISMNDFGGPDRPLKSTYQNRCSYGPERPQISPRSSLSHRPYQDLSWRVSFVFTACFVAAPATLTGGQFTVGERARTRHTQASMARDLPHPQDVCTRRTHDSCERCGPGWLDCPCARAADWPHSHSSCSRCRNQSRRSCGLVARADRSIGTGRWHKRPRT